MSALESSGYIGFLYCWWFFCKHGVIFKTHSPRHSPALLNQQNSCMSDNSLFSASRIYARSIKNSFPQVLPRTLAKFITSFPWHIIFSSLFLSITKLNMKRNSSAIPEILFQTKHGCLPFMFSRKQTFLQDWGFAGHPLGPPHKPSCMKDSVPRFKTKQKQLISNHKL